MLEQGESDGSPDFLLLKNQLCFPLYASSRLVTRLYQPLLERFDLTYPQYLVLMVLWEESPLSLKEIGNRLLLNSNTLTPLVKRLVGHELLYRERSKTDERSVLIGLTAKGKAIRGECESIPLEIFQRAGLSFEELLSLKGLLDKLLPHLLDERGQKI